MAVDYRGLVAQVKNRLSIVDFFLQRGFDLKESGTRFVALCPFHDEKTPSFTVSPERGSYHCFGCGKSGDMFNYLEEKESLGFMDALETLCDQLDIPFEIDEKDNSHASRKLMLRIMRDTWGFFKRAYDALPEDHPAKKQVSQRGITTDNDSHYDLFGWAPQNGRKLIDYLHARGYRDDDLVDAGAVRRSDKTGNLYVLWRGRLMFPIRDLTGNVVGFSGRVIFKDDKLKGKYVNSPDSDVFHKSEVLFCGDIARSKAREDHEVYIVEGQFDVVAMQMIGKTNTVASSGTAFTDKHASLLRRMVGENGRMVFCMDSDDAGQNAELKIFKALGSCQSQAYAVVTEDKDPSDMYHDDPESLRKQIASPIPLWEHIFNWTLNKHDLLNEQERGMFRNAVRNIYASIIDPDMADSFARMASLRSGMPVDTFTRDNPHGEQQKSTRGTVNAQSKSGTDPRSRSMKLTERDAVRMIKPQDPLDNIMDRILCLAVEDKKLRPRLKDLQFRGKYRRGFQQLLIMDPDRMIIPEDPIFDAPDTIMYIQWLNRLNDKLHELDHTYIPVDTEQLFNQYVKQFNKTKAYLDMQNLITSKTTILNSMDTKHVNSIDMDTINRYCTQARQMSDAITKANHVDAAPIGTRM